jgi:hypothetical protein
MLMRKPCSMRTASCFDCLFDCSVDVCGLMHVRLAFGKVGADDIITGSLLVGHDAVDLPCECPDQAFLGM